MKKLNNYLGQLRIYSLADLMLLLIVAGANAATLRFWGAVGLWVGFLAHLESLHQHSGRARVPKGVAWGLWAVSVVFFCRLEGVAFVLLSIAYAKKKQGQWGKFSPFARGLQTLMLIASLTSYFAWLPWIAAVAMGWRNWKGDRRDVEEDRADEMQTWPVVMGQERDEPIAHLMALFATTWLWWLFSEFSVWVPITINIIEISTYWLTPRASNKKAAERLHQFLREMRRWGGR